MKKTVLFILMMLSGISMGFVPTTYIEIPAIFSDNMVLQQNVNAPFWGKALPGKKISVKTNWGEAANTIVNDDSLWSLKIKTPVAGGPYKIRIQVDDSITTFNNVWIGEVWLCSGQSNMEMPMQGWLPNDTITGAKNEIKNGSENKIHFFTVGRNYSDKPQFNCSGKWQVSSPEAVAKFSATGFFFGKKLERELNVHIGLINASWGGTAVESWMSKKYLGFVNEYKEFVKNIEYSSVETAKLTDWLSRFPVIYINQSQELNKWQNLNFNDDSCYLPSFDDSRWKQINLPALWENTAIGNFDGVIWFRKKIKIPTDWLHKELVVELAAIDDMDATFVNGVKVGGYETDGHWQTERVYNIPKEVINDDIVTIATRVIDNQGGGGLYGAKEKLNIHLKGGGEKISLSGEWNYLPVAEYRGGKFFVFGSMGEKYFTRPRISVDLSASTPTSLYNGMIAPIIPYAVKGAIWYQGESNTGNPELYKTLFPLMIKNWRADWNEGNFPFYFVQIAPYKYDERTESQRLREAQFLSLAVPNTGMAVTLDIGDTDNIHPANKKDVGERLALWALAKNYNKNISYSGPLYNSYKISGNKITLTFKNTYGSLMIKDDLSQSNFLIAGKDRRFVRATVKISGDRLIVSSTEIANPAAVRYGWNNACEATLFNKINLPASSFRTDNWKE